MKHSAIRERFKSYLASQSLKLTPQRSDVFEKVFETHEHFSAETLYAWLRNDEDSKVSRATVYRTLQLLQDGGFIESLDTGRGELVYEHVVGHRHHDHMVCLGCGKIEEFQDERIEELQEKACERKGFELVSHTLRLMGYCKACARKRRREQAAAEKSGSA